MMAENGYGPAPVAGHIGRIPNFGKTQVNPMGSVEPPACIQNAMMTKDKKPFTYTPGGLDLSQIRTPSMARRLARQRSLEEQEKAYTPQQFNNGVNYHPQGGQAPPPPPPPAPKIPAPPPPPPLIIEAPNAKSTKPVPLGERPEIVIPENPIGMLRKTNSPYHWEVEKAEMQRMGPVPKFVEKVPSPLTVKLPQQRMQQTYSSPDQGRNYHYNNQAPESPLYRPEAQYGNQKSNPTNVSGSPQTRDMLVRQDSQFNKSPQPFAGQSPMSNGSLYSPAPNNNWRQPEKRDSPVNKTNSPLSQQSNRGPFSPAVQQSLPNYSNHSPPVFHTLPRAGQRNQEFANNNSQQKPVQQIPPADQSSYTPWRTNTLNNYQRGVEVPQNNTQNSNLNQQQAYSPPWKSTDANNNRTENNYVPPWKQEQKVNSQQQYSPSWSQNQTHNRIPENSNVPWRNQDVTQSTTNSQEQPRYQSSISIPVHGNQRKPNPQPEYNSPSQKEVVYVNQEPIFYCPDSPKSIPPWVKTQKEKTKTPPPAWCNRPLEGRRSAPRELMTPPRDSNQEPEWIRKSNDMQRGVREVVSPPKYQQTAQPNWSTRPSENRKSIPKDNAPNSPGARIIPIQMEVTSTETRDQNRQVDRQQPQLRIVIDMKQNPEAQACAQAPYSQPTQRIMRVLSPQLVRFDEDSRPSQHELPTLSRHLSQDSHPKTRIIPIQIESGNSGANKSFGGRY
ncbi:uncharacterized protein [Battus philenor]|uniref:uncharacterized protein isoform X1 n=1 Tax=Battus philenor TaxID=42288 RepID=UPI0035D0CBB2